jgi:arylsulfatase A-like enzyme
MGKTTEHRKYAFLVDGHYQRAIASDCYKLVWTPSGEDYSGPTTSTKNASKFFSQAWAEWLEAAINDPDAKRKLDHVLKHPLYELYDIQKDPYELVNLADDPKHTEILKKMTADLKLEITSLKDSMKMRGGNEGDGDE